jgi:DNA-binding XRE family transcriptional regulator
MVPKTKRQPNHIYSLRRNRGYLQKQLATLLGHRYTQMVSQYENGASLPPLETALLLEIALGAKLSEIYVGLYQDLQLHVLARAQQLPDPLKRQIIGRLLGKDADEHTRPSGRVA